jgi:hypothetical protein
MNQVTINNISMNGVQTPIFMSLGSRKNPTGSLKDLIISNIVATSRSKIPSCIVGVPGFYTENVVVRDMIVNCMGNGTLEDFKREVPENEKDYPENRMFGSCLPSYGLYFRHARNVYFYHIQFNLMNPDFRPAMWFEDAQNVLLRAFKVSKPEGRLHLIVNLQSKIQLLN